MNGTILDISDGKPSGRYESEEGRQAIIESTCCAKETPQFSEEKQVITRREEDLKERDVIALNIPAPINRLSDDVLCHIFELLCKDSPSVILRRKYHRRHEPPQITLSHVCSAWREIMLNVPTFWTSIMIVPRDFLKTPETIGTVVKAANILLSRAKGLPCSIDIHFPDDDDDESWPSLEPLWEKDWHKSIIRDLISLHKFKKLRVTFTDYHLRDLLQLPDDKLSCIEDLCLGYISPIENPSKASPFDLHKLSNLMSFSLLPDPFDLYPILDPTRDYFKDYFKFASIPWHNLRHIQLHAAFPPPFCMDVLKHCSVVLETCSLVIGGDDTFPTSSPRVPVYLFQLRRLRVVVGSLIRKDLILESFLLSLRFPNLESLTLGSSDHPLYLENLLQLVKARSRVDDRDDKEWIEETELQYVFLYCNEAENEIEDELLDLIEEIELSGVDLSVSYYSEESE